MSRHITTSDEIINDVGAVSFRDEVGAKDRPATVGSCEQKIETEPHWIGVNRDEKCRWDDGAVLMTLGLAGLSLIRNAPQQQYR